MPAWIGSGPGRLALDSTIELLSDSNGPGRHGTVSARRRTAQRSGALAGIHRSAPIDLPRRCWRPGVSIPAGITGALRKTARTCWGAPSRLCAAHLNNAVFSWLGTHNYSSELRSKPGGCQRRRQPGGNCFAPRRPPTTTPASLRPDAGIPQGPYPKRERQPAYRRGPAPGRRRARAATAVGIAGVAGGSGSTAQPREACSPMA